MKTLLAVLATGFLSAPAFAASATWTGNWEPVTVGSVLGVNCEYEYSDSAGEEISVWRAFPAPSCPEEIEVD